MLLCGVAVEVGLFLGLLALVVHGQETLNQVVDRLDLTVCLDGYATLKVNRTTAWFEYLDLNYWLSRVHPSQIAVGWSSGCSSDHAVIANNQVWKAYDKPQPNSFEISTPFSVNFTQRGMESGLSIVREDWLRDRGIACGGTNNCTGEFRTRIVEQPLPINNYTATIELINALDDTSITHTISIVPWSVSLPRYDNLTLKGSLFQAQPGLNPSPRCTDQPCMLLAQSTVASCACLCFAQPNVVHVDCSASPRTKPINATMLPANTRYLVIGYLINVKDWECGHFSPLHQLEKLKFDRPFFLKGCLYDGIRDTLKHITHRAQLESDEMLVEPSTFQNLPQLSILDIGVSPAIVPQVISDTMFLGTPNILTLNMEHSSLTWIPDNLFASLTQLKDLNLGGNVVRFIPENMFGEQNQFFVRLPSPCTGTSRAFSCDCEAVDAVTTSSSVCEPTCATESIGDSEASLDSLPTEALHVQLSHRSNSSMVRFKPGDVVNVTSGTFTAEFECSGIRGVPTWQPTAMTLRERCLVSSMRDPLGVNRSTYTCKHLLFNPQQNAFTIPKSTAVTINSLVLEAPLGLRFLTRNMLTSVARHLHHMKVQDVMFSDAPEPHTFAAAKSLQSLELVNTNLHSAMLDSTPLWYFLARLKYLDLSYNPISTLSSTMWTSLTKLSSLILTSTHLTSLGDVLSQPMADTPIISRTLSLLNIAANTMAPFHVGSLVTAFPNLTTLSVSGFKDPLSVATAPLPVFPFLPTGATGVIENGIRTLHLHNVTHLSHLEQFPSLRELHVTNHASVPFRLLKGALPATLIRLVVDAAALDYIEPGALEHLMIHASELSSGQPYVVSINTRDGALDTTSSVSCTRNGCACFGTRNASSPVGCVKRCSVLKTAGVACIYPDVCEVVCDLGEPGTPVTAKLSCDLATETFVSSCMLRVESKSTTPIVVGTVVAVLVSLVGVASLLLLRQRRAYNMVQSVELFQHKVNTLLVSRYPQLHGQSLTIPPLFQLNSLRVEEEIGKGNFSRVSRAITLAHGAVGSLAAGASVALKTTDDDAASLTAALLEAQLMHTFSHPNIVGVVAISLQSASCHLVLELMDQSLLSFVRQLETPLPESTIASIMLDVAMACEHVASCNIVHRDLSARNCGILHRGKGLTPKAKLFDFGLARVCNDGGVYTSSTQQQAQPIAWMAPESLTDEVFSERSDVWGFGVLCWEINSMGARPWSQFMVQEIVVAVSKQGKHLERPGTLQVPGRCSDRIWDILCQCWQQNAHHRPPFLELVRLISTFSSAPLTAATSVPYNSQTSPCLSEVSTSLDEESAALRSATTSAVAPLGNWCQPEQVQEPSFHQTNQLFHFVLDQRRDDSEVHL
eukprot:m.286618 g.286618  ORF g.286618 m.286618 type:complete len:1361 (+) comp15780_c4_seq16:81-4163(+)